MLRSAACGRRLTSLLLLVLFLLCLFFARACGVAENLLRTKRLLFRLVGHVGAKQAFQGWLRRARRRRLFGSEQTSSRRAGYWICGLFSRGLSLGLSLRLLRQPGLFLHALRSFLRESNNLLS